MYLSDYKKTVQYIFNVFQIILPVELKVVTHLEIINYILFPFVQ